ncbi:MAG: tetratricopeptide repeat protein [Brevinematia bacterium]
MKKIVFLFFILLTSTVRIEDAHFNLAKKWYDDKKFDKAAKEFEEIYNKYPFYESNNTVLYYAGKSYFNIKDYKKSIYFFDKLYVNSKREIEKRQSTFELGKSYFFSANYAKALLFFQEFISKYNDSPVIHAAIYYAANSNEKIGRKTEAILLYDFLIQSYPDSPYVNNAKNSINSLLNISSYDSKKSNIKIEDKAKPEVEKKEIIITNIISITNELIYEKTNTYTNVFDFSVSKEREIPTNTEPKVDENEKILLETLKKENLKDEEELRRYQQLIELKNRLLRMKQKLIEEKKEIANEIEE